MERVEPRRLADAPSAWNPFMAQPDGFSWIEEPLLAGMAQPGSVEELTWLRQQGIELLVALTEDPPPRRWINDAGLFLAHFPIADYTPPDQEHLDKILETIERAHARKLGV